MKLKLLTISALAALTASSFGAAITVFNFRGAATNFVLDGVTDQLLPGGSGSVALGTFDTDPAGGGVLEPGAIGTILDGFTQFSNTASIGVGAVGGVYQTVLNGAIAGDSALVGKNVFTVIGNGSSLRESNQLLVYKHAHSFKADPDATDDTLLGEDAGGELLIGSFGKIGEFGPISNPSFSLAPAIPEPSAIALLFGGMSFLLVGRRSRK